ncbi:MAG: hypothetical protein II937_04340 [Bacteroidales bacterium]|nr:hypothetical protein [Bacteroidales bacterium]
MLKISGGGDGDLTEFNKNPRTDDSYPHISAGIFNCQLSIVNCQLSTVNCQLSIVNSQLSVILNQILHEIHIGEVDCAGVVLVHCGDLRHFIGCEGEVEYVEILNQIEVPR